MIRFNCTSCGGIIKTKDENAGRKAQCPHCRVALEMPAAGTDTVQAAAPTANTATPPPKTTTVDARKPGDRPTAAPKRNPIAARPASASPQDGENRPPTMKRESAPPQVGGASAIEAAPNPHKKKPQTPPAAPVVLPASASVPTPGSDAGRPTASRRSRLPLIVSVAAALLVGVAAILLSGGTGGEGGDAGPSNGSTTDGQGSGAGASHPDSVATFNPGDSTASIKTAPSEVIHMKPVNVGTARDQTVELKIPDNVKLSLPAVRTKTSAEVAAIARQLTKLVAAISDQRMKLVAQLQESRAWAMACDKDKALEALPAHAHPLLRTMALTVLGTAHLQKGDRPAAKAAADEALVAAGTAATPDQAKQAPNRQFILTPLADLFGQLGDEKSQGAAAFLAGPGRAQRPEETTMIALQASLARGEVSTALKHAEALPSPVRRNFFYWLARQHEERGDKPAAAVLYLRSLKLEQAGADPANDGRLVFDSITHEAITGLLRCGARTIAIEHILTLPPRQSRRQAYLEMAVSYLLEQGDHATAIAAAINGGDLVTAAEAQLRAGLSADAAVSLKRVVSALPVVPMTYRPSGDDQRAQTARVNLLFKIAGLQIRAGDSEGAVQTIDRVAQRFSKTPVAAADLGTNTPTEGMDFIYVGDSHAAWQFPRLQAALLYAGAGRLDKATSVLDSIVAMNKWFVDQMQRVGTKSIPPVYQPTESPHHATPLIEAEYAGHLFRAGKKDESAVYFDKAILAELAAMSAVKLPDNNSSLRPEQRKPPSRLLLIAQSRAKAGDLEGLVTMFSRQDIANVHYDDGGQGHGELHDAARDVSVALAKAGQISAALRVSRGLGDARVEIAEICSAKQDHGAVLEALTDAQSHMGTGAWIASPRQYSRSGTPVADEEASTPQLRLLASAAAKVELTVLQTYVEKAQGYGLRVIAKARADAGDKVGARKLLEQGLEQAAIQDRQIRQLQLIDALRQIGEANLADAAQAVVNASSGGQLGGVIHEGDGDGDEGRRTPANITPEQFANLVKAVEDAADPQTKAGRASQAMQASDLILNPTVLETFNPNAFSGTVMNAQLLDRIERRWVNVERPPTILGGAAGGEPDGIEMIARELRLYRRVTNYAIPQSLDELAIARKLDVKRLAGGSPQSIEVIKGLPLDSGPQVVLLIDRTRRPGGIVGVVTVPGLVEMLTEDELQQRLKSPPVVTFDGFDKRTYPPETRWAAYGEPPVVVDRVQLSAVDKAAQAPAKQQDKFVGSNTIRETQNLHNLGATLRAYALANGGRIPDSIQQLRDSGFLIHEEDVIHPLGETFSYTFIPGKPVEYFGKPPIAVDSAPMFETFGISSENELLYRQMVRYVSHRGQVEVANQFVENVRLSAPPLRTFNIEPQEPVHIKARKQLINVRTALQRYAEKNGGKFPAELADLVKQKFLPNETSLQSPVDTKSTYVYIPGLTLASPSHQILIYDPMSCNYPAKELLLVGYVGFDVGYCAGNDFSIKRLPK